jgi:hypothetical protein
MRGLLFALALAALAVTAAHAQETSTKRNTQGPVTVAVTLLTPVGTTPIKVKVVLDTHSVALDGVAFDQAVALRTPDGREVAPAVEETKGSGHHREATLVFIGQAAGALRIVVKNVGGVAERAFAWDATGR